MLGVPVHLVYCQLTNSSVNYFQIFRDIGLTHKHHLGIAIRCKRELLILGDFVDGIIGQGCWCAVDWQKMYKIKDMFWWTKHLVLVLPIIGSKHFIFHIMQ